MTLERITAPASALLTLDEIKAHLRVDTANEDAYISSLALAADAHFDGYAGTLGRALITQTWELRLDAFPSAKVKLPLPPLQSVTSVKYIDTASVEQTVVTTVYQVVTGGTSGGFIKLADGQSWPADLKNESDAVRIRFVAGYGAASDVPAPMPPDIADHVAAVALLGTPSDRFMGVIQQPPVEVGPAYEAKTIELCVPNDFVCSAGNDIGAHARYISDGLVVQAADFAASKLSESS